MAAINNVLCCVSQLCCCEQAAAPRQSCQQRHAVDPRADGGAQTPTNFVQMARHRRFPHRQRQAVSWRRHVVAGNGGYLLFAAGMYKSYATAAQVRIGDQPCHTTIPP